MNRFTAAGIVGSILQGDRVIVVTRTAHDARVGLDELKALGLEEHGVLTFERAVGKEKAAAVSGGWVRFLPRGRLSGESADTVLVEDGIEIDRVFEGHLRAILAASPKGELLRS